MLPSVGHRPLIPSEFRGIFMTWQSFKQAWLIRFWSPVPAVIAAGILSTYYFGITGTFWAVTGEFTRWGGQLLQLLGVHSEQWGYYQLIHLEGSPLTRIDGRMIIGMFGGCLAAALWANSPPGRPLGQPGLSQGGAQLWPDHGDSGENHHRRGLAAGGAGRPRSGKHHHPRHFRPARLLAGKPDCRTTRLRSPTCKN